ncbi:MAG: glycosyltransferase family 4 protein [Phycisphaeraceae bacterium]|nr:glycosyltransferase family 4 protein [Phycisphaeraceae bacterium]
MPGSPIRTIICEPALAKYRLPAWRALAARPGISLHLEYASDGHVPNVDPVGIDGHFTPARKVFQRPELFWHAGYLAALDRTPTPDVVILNWNVRFLDNPVAILKARRKKMGIVFFGHGVSKNETPARKNIRNALGRRADCILVYSGAARDGLIKDGFEPDRVFVAPNSVDQTDIQAARRDWAARPRDLEAFQRTNDLGQSSPSLPFPAPVLIFCARLDPLRRLELLFEALPTIAQSHHGTQLLIVGGGEDEQRLREIASKLNLLNPANSQSARVRFLGPVYEEKNLAPWFLSSDLMVFPSHMGLSVLHAMGYGVPVITCNDASKHGPEYDVIKPGINGDVYQDGSVPDLAAKVIALLNDRAKLRAMSAEALLTATRDYSIEKMIDGFEAAIRFANARRGKLL